MKKFDEFKTVKSADGLSFEQNLQGYSVAGWYVINAGMCVDGYRTMWFAVLGRNFK